MIEKVIQYDSTLHIIMHLLSLLHLMSNEVSITISKILNWSINTNNTRLQVAFYVQSTKNYLAHKTTVGYYSNQSLIVNTSFKIHFNPSEHIILCKISEIIDKNNMRDVGQVQIDLNLLNQRKLIYIPFQDMDKVLEVKIYQGKKDGQPELETNGQAQQFQQKRQQFLQQRFDFLDRIAEHQTQLKKKFSQKVYNLLKQIKTRGLNDFKQRQNTKLFINESKDTKNKNQLQFRTRLSEQKKKTQLKRNDVFSHPQIKNNRYSPAKQKLDNQLLIHSLHTKHQIKSQQLQERNYNDNEMNKEIKSPSHEERIETYISNNLNNPFQKNQAFGGVLKDYKLQ